jgi:ethanolamine utilization protein EutQ (cupin superfamily)
MTTVYGYRLNEVQFKESDKLPEAEVYLKDIVDSSVSKSMSAGYARYAKGISNDWTVDYDEVIVVISGVFTIHSEGSKSTTLKAGDFFFLTRDTSVTYQADEASVVMYVTYPHWREAARKAGRL